MIEKAKGIVWDLSFLYDDPDDERITADLDRADELADAFVAAWRGRIKAAGLTAAELMEAIGKLEEVYRYALPPYHFATLKFSENTQEQRHLALLERVRMRFTDINNKLVFFNVELMEMPDETAERIASDPAFEHYRYWLLEARKNKPYTLSEKEEQIINLKDSTGKNAFVQLYEEITSGLKFELEIDGEKKTLTGEETASYFMHPDRELRRKAFDAFFEVYRDNAKLITSILNTLVRDHANECRLRGYPDAMTPAYLRDQVSPETIANLMDAVRDNYGLVERYYKLKARILGLDVLKGWDRSAPVGKDYKFDWDRARETVVESYSAFDAEVGERVAGFFSKRWIDAEVRPGKRGGAFCSGTMPHLNPVVLMSFNDRLKDVFTLAHELGHGVHDLYAAEKQGLVTYHPPLVAAETASVFGEMLLTDKLLKEADDEMRRDILCDQLEGVFNTCSRQIMYVFFEKKVHERGAAGRLSPDEIAALWEEEEKALYGSSIEFHPLQKYYWARVGHFFFSRFYCFAYAFGKMFVLALYQRYLEDPEGFVPAYKEMLRAGGQYPPHVLASKLDMDITKRDFWESGFRYVEKLLGDLEKLV